MDASKELFQERYGLDCRRQPGRESNLRDLVATWKALFPAMTHPYEMEWPEKASLAKASVYFGGGSTGRRVDLANQFLYALTSVRKLDSLARLRSDDEDEVIHDRLIVQAGNPPQWIPLAPLVFGPLDNSDRKFTWWTTMDIVGLGQPFVAGRRLGLLDTWIADLALILRWKIDPRAASIHQPTCCDGFDGPVFESMPEASEKGRTINLNAEPLTGGEPEFAVTSLPVDQISVYPIRIGSDLRATVLPAVLDDEMTWNRLAAYYRAAT